MKISYIVTRFGSYESTCNAAVVWESPHTMDSASEAYLSLLTFLRENLESIEPPSLSWCCEGQTTPYCPMCGKCLQFELTSENVVGYLLEIGKGELHEVHWDIEDSWGIGYVSNLVPGETLFIEQDAEEIALELLEDPKSPRVLVEETEGQLHLRYNHEV